MPARRPDSGRTALLAGAMLAAACATRSPAPPSWQVPANEVDRSSHGAWANVTLRGGGGLSGELLAVDDQALYVGLTPRLTRVPHQCVTRLQLAAFEIMAVDVSGLGAVGMLSTISHGFFLVFTVPIWVTTAGLSSYGHSRAGHLKFGLGEEPLPRASAWSRFPAGMPTGYIDRVPERVALDATCQPLRLGAPP
jgi:hypothetical protein